MDDKESKLSRLSKLSKVSEAIRSMPEKGLPGLLRAHIKAAQVFLEDDGTLLAAAVAYYSLLSAVPLLLGLASIAAFFIDREWAIQQATTLMGAYIPQGTVRIREIVQQTIEQRESVGLVSILAFFWSGSRVFSALTKALNNAFNVEESYSFLKRTGLELAMAVTIGLFFIAAVVTNVVLNLLLGVLYFLPDGQEQVGVLASEVASAGLLLAAFFLVYKVVPRRTVTPTAALVGAATATALFTLARPLFVGYVELFANYSAIYGPLAIVIMLVFWAWVSAVILLYGGEVTAQIEEMVQEASVSGVKSDSFPET